MYSGLKTVGSDLLTFQFHGGLTECIALFYWLEVKYFQFHGGLTSKKLRILWEFRRNFQFHGGLTSDPSRHEAGMKEKTFNSMED